MSDQPKTPQNDVALATDHDHLVVETDNSPTAEDGPQDDVSQDPEVVVTSDVMEEPEGSGPGMAS